MTQTPLNETRSQERRPRAAQQAVHTKQRRTINTHQVAEEHLQAREIAFLQTRVDSVQERTEMALQQQSETTVRATYRQHDHESITDHPIQH
ncbi:hypothetical protein [Plantibacter sp. CFBP 8775]|uniref:hypothetical protein n=1 Tax=Plantibacter sp. CFBP 8775 TaxID=2774038 RepID=UPI00177F0729|nr:hypothetical protein [Plantibacter sp. CFBP 8775]MBD8104754.1 hypothetical protein [Plantibacter sp. CFBP 8775]